MGWTTRWETRSGLVRGSYQNVSRARVSTCMSERWGRSEGLGLISHHFYPPDSLGGGSDWFACGLPGSLCNSYPYDTNPQQLPSRLGGPPPSSVACTSSSLPHSSFLSAWPQPEASETSMTWEFPHLPCSILLAQAGTDDVGVPAPQGTWPGLGASAPPPCPPCSPRAFPPDTCSPWLELGSTRTTTP